MELGEIRSSASVVRDKICYGKSDCSGTTDPIVCMDGTGLVREVEFSDTANEDHIWETPKAENNQKVTNYLARCVRNRLEGNGIKDSLMGLALGAQFMRLCQIIAEQTRPYDSILLV
jgi:hypothetical protein